MSAYHALVAVAAGLLAIAFTIYAYLCWKNLPILESQRTPRTFVDLFSHLPVTESGPAPHVIAGASLLTGLSLLVGIFLADRMGEEERFFEITIASAGLLIAVSFSFVTIWTLWQTRRIDFRAGYKIFDFLDLIKKLNLELDALTKSYVEVYDKRAQPFHRVYLVTTEPFLGSLSYKDLPAQKAFRNHLEELSKLRAQSLRSKANGDQTFEFHVVCGDAETILKFHREFYNGANQPVEEIERAAKEANQDIARFNQMVQEAGGEGPFYRTNRIPPVQFMVIGNKLFEFTLESQGSMTEIFNTQVVFDTRFCRNYIETFDVFREFVRNPDEDIAA
ncbi:MAG TPA: hypothetical protein VF782_06420 [Allosphingosinicella sp.]|jgi:hypothetical protein